MGSIFNSTTHFNRVTKQDVSDTNLPPPRESTQRFCFIYIIFHGISRGDETLYRSRLEACSFFRRAIIRSSSGLLPARSIWATEIPCWMPASIAISQLAICPEKTIIRRPAVTARSACSKPCVSTRPLGSKTRIFTKMRVFGRDTAEIVPHAGDDARDVGVRKLRKGATDVALSVFGDA